MKNSFRNWDGKPMSGPHGYTNQSIREAWHRRPEQEESWKKTGGHSDITEAVEHQIPERNRLLQSLVG
jgi:hypothetical protein